MVSILVTLPLSPVSWSATVVPVMIVLIWSALKDGAEDMGRKCDEDSENDKQCLRFVAATGDFERVTGCDLHAGDILCIARQAAFPADLFLLYAPRGRFVFLSSANLDGETNWKPRALPAGVPAGLRERASRQLRKSTNEPLPEWAQKDREDTVTRLGRMYTAGMPRGCILQGCPWVVAVAAYVGQDTKARLNATRACSKIPTMQTEYNKCLIYIALSLFFGCLYLMIMGAFCEGVRFVRIVQYVILLYQMVPVSLYVCFECFKLPLAYRVHHDQKMIDPRDGEAAAMRTSDIVEDLDRDVDGKRDGARPCRLARRPGPGRLPRGGGQSIQRAAAVRRDACQGSALVEVPSLLPGVGSARTQENDAAPLPVLRPLQRPIRAARRRRCPGIRRSLARRDRPCRGGRHRRHLLGQPPAGPQGRHDEGRDGAGRWGRDRQ